VVVALRLDAALVVVGCGYMSVDWAGLQFDDAAGGCAGGAAPWYYKYGDCGWLISILKDDQAELENY